MSDHGREWANDPRREAPLDPNPGMDLFQCPHASTPTRISLVHCRSRQSLALRIIRYSYFYRKYLLSDSPESNLSEGDLLRCLQCEMNPERETYLGVGWDVFHGLKRPAGEGQELDPVVAESQLMNEFTLDSDELKRLREEFGMPFFQIDGDCYYRREVVRRWLSGMKGLLLRLKDNKHEREDDLGMEELMTVLDVSRVFHVSPETVRSWHRQGLLPPARRLGRRLLWTRKDIETVARRGERGNSR